MKTNKIYLKSRYIASEEDKDTSKSKPLLNEKDTKCNEIELN